MNICSLISSQCVPSKNFLKLPTDMEIWRILAAYINSKLFLIQTIHSIDFKKEIAQKDIYPPPKWDLKSSRKFYFYTTFKILLYINIYIYNYMNYKWNIYTIYQPKTKNNIRWTLMYSKLKTRSFQKEQNYIYIYTLIYMCVYLQDL